MRRRASSSASVADRTPDAIFVRLHWGHGLRASRQQIREFAPRRSCIVNVVGAAAASCVARCSHIVSDGAGAECDVRSGPRTRIFSLEGGEDNGCGNSGYLRGYHPVRSARCAGRLSISVFSDPHQCMASTWSEKRHLTESALSSVLQDSQSNRSTTQHPRRRRRQRLAVSIRTAPALSLPRLGQGDGRLSPTQGLLELLR